MDNIYYAPIIPLPTASFMALPLLVILGTISKVRQGLEISGDLAFVIPPRAILCDNGRGNSILHDETADERYMIMLPADKPTGSDRLVSQQSCIERNISHKNGLKIYTAMVPFPRFETTVQSW